MTARHTTLEQVLPLRHSSDLQQRPFVQLLVAASNGLLGDVSRILNAAAERAILDNSERITLRHLQQACDART
jgi:AAA+ superfamily predicted ATPase